MRVFQVNTVYNTGSTGRIVANLKHLLEQSGDECYAAYGRGNSTEENTCLVSNRLDLYVHALYTRMTDKTGFLSICATRKLIRKIRETNPDLIHLHNIHGYYLNVEMLFQFLKEYGKPVVWTLHDCWPFTGHCVHYEQFGMYSKCDRWQSQCGQCERISEYPKSLRDHSAWNYVHKKQAFTGVDNLVIVTVSDWLKKQVEKSFLKMYPVETIYNGLDLDKFATIKDMGLREKYNLGDRKIVLGVANGWSLLKGLHDFEELAEFLDSKGYLIVVLGVEETKRKKITSGIFALPRTESVDELAAWYSIAEVHFNASRAETFGMTVIEALACGTPVVAYRICAMPELLNPECGFLVEQTGDVKTVAEMIMRCDKKIMREACLAQSRKYEKNSSGERYLKLYQEVLSGAR